MTERPYILAVCNRKGGTGKTTTAVNLGAEMAARGLATLLVDLDTQGHLTLGAGRPEPDKATPTAHQAFTRPDFDFAAAIQPTEHANLWLVPADPLFDGTGVPHDLTMLARHLRGPAVLGRFDIAVLDTPPSHDIVLMNAIAAAHGVVVPVLPSALGLNGVHQLTRLIFRIASTANPGLKLLGILPVMADHRVKLHKTVLGELKAHFGADRMLPGIRTDVRLAEAFLARRPVRAFAPRSRGALDFHLLAEDLLTYWIPKAHDQRH